MRELELAGGRAARQQSTSVEVGLILILHGADGCGEIGRTSARPCRAKRVWSLTPYLPSCEPPPWSVDMYLPARRDFFPLQSPRRLQVLSAVPTHHHYLACRRRVGSNTNRLPPCGLSLASGPSHPPVRLWSHAPCYLCFAGRVLMELFIRIVHLRCRNSLWRSSLQSRRYLCPQGLVGFQSVHVPATVTCPSLDSSRRQQISSLNRRPSVVLLLFENSYGAFRLPRIAASRWPALYLSLSLWLPRSHGLQAELPTRSNVDPRLGLHSPVDPDCFLARSSQPLSRDWWH
jgi:hypothetical protein